MIEGDYVDYCGYYIKFPATEINRCIAYVADLFIEEMSGKRGDTFTVYPFSPTRLGYTSITFNTFTLKSSGIVYS